MFSPNIVSSEEFLEMPISSQALYFHLGMNADDDGFIQPKLIMRLTGSGDDDLKVLLTKRFLLAFDGGVVVIKHWLIHNMIRADRYKATRFQDQKKLLKIKDNNAYTEINKLGCQNDNQSATQVRLGKVRLDKIVASDIFSFEEEIEKIKIGTRKDLKIMAFYWKKKGWVFENRKQFESALRRELKPAKALLGYTSEQVGEVVRFCQDNYEKIGWTLETCSKRIDSIVNKK